MVESRYMELLCQVKKALFNILDGFLVDFWNFCAGLMAQKEGYKVILTDRNCFAQIGYLIEVSCRDKVYGVI
jgi:hypothetical protein